MDTQGMVTLKEALHGAELVAVVDAGDMDLLYVWHGGLTVNLYSREEQSDQFDAVSCWTMPQDKATKEEVARSIVEHARDGINEYGGYEDNVDVDDFIQWAQELDVAVSWDEDEDTCEILEESTSAPLVLPIKSTKKGNVIELTVDDTRTTIISDEDWFYVPHDKLRDGGKYQQTVERTALMLKHIDGINVQFEFVESEDMCPPLAVVDVPSTVELLVSYVLERSGFSRLEAYQKGRIYKQMVTSF